MENFVYFDIKAIALFVTLQQQKISNSNLSFFAALHIFVIFSKRIKIDYKI